MASTLPTLAPMWKTVPNSDPSSPVRCSTGSRSQLFKQPPYQAQPHLPCPQSTSRQAGHPFGIRASSATFPAVSGVRTMGRVSSMGESDQASIISVARVQVTGRARVSTMHRGSTPPERACILGLTRASSRTLALDSIRGITRVSMEVRVSTMEGRAAMRAARVGGRQVSFGVLAVLFVRIGVRGHHRQAEMHDW